MVYDGLMDPQQTNPPENNNDQDRNTNAKSTMTSQSDPNNILNELKHKIDNANLPLELKNNLNERIARLELLRSGNGISTSSYIIELENSITYINWVLSLPWFAKSEDLLDLVRAKQILDKNHYALQNVKDRILEYLAEIILNAKNHSDGIIRSPVLCLIGLAGTGKTTLGESIAQSLGRKFERIPFGGMGDARALRGQSRAFPDAEPGYIIKKLAHAKTKNAVILLDELDRVADSARTDIMGVLVELLDPEQNKAYTDHYIDYPFDLSNVLFVATANNTTNIATAVLDRLEIIQMPSYTDEEKVVIAKNYLFPKLRAQTGLAVNQLEIADDVWEGIIRPLGFDSGIRSLQRTIEGICRKVAREIVEGKIQTMVITNGNLKEFLQTW